MGFSKKGIGDSRANAEPLVRRLHPGTFCYKKQRVESANEGPGEVQEAPVPSGGGKEVLFFPAPLGGKGICSGQNSHYLGPLRDL